mmetsp:Transcript_98778/g.318579  ORF Transcript_98778/g.318579 Transcript_98778/m.318579 type:complete len:292 (-) Transcript_98778:39-914(-)
MATVPSSPTAACEAGAPGQDVPAVIEVFSSSARSWFVALVVSEVGGALTVRFLDAGGTAWEKSAFREDPRLAAFGTNVGGQLPPGFEAVPSISRPGRFAYLDVAGHQKYGSPELAWQAFLEHRVLDGTLCDGPAKVMTDTHKVCGTVGGQGAGRVATIRPGGPTGAAAPRTLSRASAAPTVANPVADFVAAAAPAVGSQAVSAATRLPDTGRGLVEGPWVFPAKPAVEDLTLPPGYSHAKRVGQPYNADEELQAQLEAPAVPAGGPWWAAEPAAALPPPARRCPSFPAGGR